MTTSFNLLHEPWIMVRRDNGTLDEVSLTQAVREAPGIREVVGDIPTQALAIQRLILAVLYRGITWDHPGDTERWRQIWNAGHLPTAEVEQYLSRHTDRFDLLHPATPFCQVADLRTSKGEFFGLERLIADIPVGEQYFTTRAGEGVSRIGFAEAARWAVHCQACDPSGIKSGAVGDERVKGGKGYPIGVAWAGQLGGLLIEGNTLFETLMLNLVLATEHAAHPQPDDKPPWEMPPLGASARSSKDSEPQRPEHPTGPIDALTWQSRRIRLQHDSSGVTGVLISNGDALRSHNQFHNEFWTTWRFSEPQSKKLGGKQYLPRLHDPDRALWRGLNAILADITDENGATRTLAPAVSHWITRLVNEDIMPAESVLRPHAFGLNYINNDSVVGAAIDDTVLLHAVLLGELGASLRVCAADAVRAADAAATALAHLAGNLAQAAGGEPDGPRSRARDLLYFDIDSHYRTWLSTLDADTDELEALTAWHIAVRRSATTAGAELVASAGQPAWVGREVNGRHVDTALAEGWFAKALRDALSYAYPAPRSTTTQEEGPQHDLD